MTHEESSQTAGGRTDSDRGRRHRHQRTRRVTRGLTACWIAALSIPAAACTLALSGPTGDDITTSGTTGNVLLGSLLILYTITALRPRNTRAKRSPSH